MSFLELRNSIVNEAKASPNLLSDLAGLEKYISETYDSRTFVELIQNAEDAGSKRFKVKNVTDNLIVVSNDGSPFNHEDLSSLCRSAASKKIRGNSIGFRGIGFKSVVNLCSKVHLVSGEYEVTFSRDLTHKDIPEAKNVPLIRIPHTLDSDIKEAINDYVKEQKNLGMTTFFIFEGVISRNVSNELTDLDASSLMFLTSLSEVEIDTTIKKFIRVDRVNKVNYQYIRVSTDHELNEYYSFSSNKNFNIAVRISESGDAVSMNSKEAVVHSFLPSFEESGINAKIQGDISTDPSRTRVVLDDKTSEVIRDVAEYVVNMLKNFLFQYSSNSDDKKLIENFFKAVILIRDPRSIFFQKNCFMTEYYSTLQLTSRGVFSNFRTRPRWLNSNDYFGIMKNSNLSSVSEDLFQLEKADILLKHIGVIESPLSEVLDHMDDFNLSILGCAQLISKLINLQSIGQIDLSSINVNLKLWFCEGRAYSYSEFCSSFEKIEPTLIDMIIELNPNKKQIIIFLQKLYGVNNNLNKFFTADFSETNQIKIVNDSSNTTTTDVKIQAYENKGLNFQPSKKILKDKWRNAEEIFAQIFESHGWEVKDVTKQNVGYDYHCISKLGDELFVEVKNIKSEHEGFHLTSNEEAVARLKGDRYVLALVRESITDFEIALIYEPLNKIKLTRQCRQWVWFCENFPFEPVSYPKLY